MIILSALILGSICLSSVQPRSGERESVTAGTELMFVLLVHRHGDRTPEKAFLSYLKDTDEDIQKLIEPWGYGQLTDSGKRTGYKTGQFIRRRYDKLIAAKYNQSEMYIRSTDSTRTKMTVLCAMSAVYPATDDSWSNDINWVPTPYTVVPVKYDYNLPLLNCPKYMAFLASLIKNSINFISKHSSLYQRLADITVKDKMSKFSYYMAFAMNDLIVSLKGLGYKLPLEIILVQDEIAKMADKVIEEILAKEEYLSFQAGVLLNDFFTYADKVISGQDTQRVRIYSAHDFNVYSLEAISKAVPRQGVPKYGSVFALELRHVVSTGDYVVLPVYLADPHDGREQYLRVEGCGDVDLCHYAAFHKLTAADLRTEDAWRSECGFTEDMYIDTSNID